jgi:hypothetical protein
MALVVRLLPVMRFPLFKPVRGRLAALLDDAGLVLDPHDVPAMDPVETGEPAAEARASSSTDES